MITDATGVSKVIMEVAKSSSMRRTGVTALLWHVMRGAPSMLHSKAETVWHLLMDKSIFSLGEKYPEGKFLLYMLLTLFFYFCSICC